MTSTGKRKKSTNISENCDGWLSTRNKRKISPVQQPFKKHRASYKVLTVNTKENRPFVLTQNSPPPPELQTCSKQSNIKAFFKAPNQAVTQRQNVSPTEPSTVSRVLYPGTSSIEVTDDEIIRENVVSNTHSDHPASRVSDLGNSTLNERSCVYVDSSDLEPCINSLNTAHCQGLYDENQSNLTDSYFDSLDDIRAISESSGINNERTPNQYRKTPFDICLKTNGDSNGIVEKQSLCDFQSEGTVTCLKTNGDSNDIEENKSLSDSQLEGTIICLKTNGDSNDKEYTESLCDSQCDSQSEWTVKSYSQYTVDLTPDTPDKLHLISSEEADRELENFSLLLNT